MSARTSSSQPLPLVILRITLCFVLGCPLLPRLAHGQATQNTQSELETAIARAKSGNADGSNVEVIANAGAVQAVPALEEQFKRATDVDTKVAIAYGLVRLRDRDDTYWNFLLQQATLAVDSGTPDPAYSQSQGKMAVPSPELQAWADAHNVSVDAAWHNASIDVPGKVMQLAMTGDPRGIPLLRRALESHNYLIAAFAAKGLAQIQDKQSIPLIVAAAQKAPTGYTSLIAESLLYFDDKQAQSAADQFIPKEKAKVLREAITQGMGVFGG